MALAAVLAQTAVVRFNYVGNGTALFRHGLEFPPPAAVVAAHPQLVIFPPGAGYDGQFYHSMAHDPFFRAGSERSMDDARLRYRRILGPLAAWILSAGQGRFVDAAYDLVLAGAVFLGVWSSGACARICSRTAAWGAAFALIPATAISLDRMTPDVVLAALTAALALAVQADRRGLALVVSMTAPLVRETGWLVLLAYGASLVLQRQWRRAGLVILAGLPALAWYAYVHWRLPAQPYPLLAVPLSGMWTAAMHPPADTAVLAPAMRVAGLLALAGMLAAFVWAVVLWRRDPRGALPIAGLLFAALGLLVQRPDHWIAAHDYGRVYSPLFVLLALDALTRGTAWPLLPVALVWPRLALEMRGEALGVLRGIF